MTNVVKNKAVRTHDRRVSCRSIIVVGMSMVTYSNSVDDDEDGVQMIIHAMYDVPCMSNCMYCGCR